MAKVGRFKVDLGGEDGQPVAFMAMADKDDFDLMVLFGFHHYAGQNPGLTSPSRLCPDPFREEHPSQGVSGASQSADFQ
ncbi:MAG: hypothetical protein PHI97_23645 [Desulfobulbus sp.]|nr:hypothetical protein [Desulfobulbus sp.]